MVAGTGAAVAGLAFGLHEVKRVLKATEAQDLWKIASVELRKPYGLDFVTARNAERQKLVRHLAATSKVSVEAFQNSARHLRPVELQLEELQERFPVDLDEHSDKSSRASRQPKTKGVEESAERLVEKEKLLRTWEERGYLSATAGAPNVVFGRRLTSDAQGVDIGTCVPPYLLPESERPAIPTPAWMQHERDEAASALHRWGCVLLRDVLTSEDVASYQKAFGLGVGSSARRAGEVGQVLQSCDANIQMGRYTFGRLHCLLRGSPTFEPLALATHTALAPLVHTYFRAMEDAHHRVFLSEAQLVIADPCAERQSWYVNSLGGPGLTIIVPLTKVNADTGAYSILPGTHMLNDSSMSIRERIQRCFSALCATHGAVSVVNETSSPEWCAGDALVLDGRVLHRALDNDSFGAPVPVLILRYDLAHTPPPGCGRWTLLFMTRLGGLLDAVFKLYSVV